MPTRHPRAGSSRYWTDLIARLEVYRSFGAPSLVWFSSCSALPKMLLPLQQGLPRRNQSLNSCSSRRSTLFRMNACIRCRRRAANFPIVRRRGRLRVLSLASPSLVKLKPLGRAIGQISPACFSSSSSACLERVVDRRTARARRTSSPFPWRALLVRSAMLLPLCRRCRPAGVPLHRARLCGAARVLHREMRRLTRNHFFILSSFSFFIFHLCLPLLYTVLYCTRYSYILIYSY